jgi:serine/threonine protein kinase
LYHSGVSLRFGRYELLRALGSGGMAEVFLARYVGPEGFEKRLVIKRVLPRFASDSRLLRMFFEEARTHVSLSHGNLVSVFDFGRVGDEYFIAMEHVRGADLGLLLSDSRLDGARLPPSTTAHLGIELCRGLGYVHRRGFVHRDVSPRNVLISVDGEVKLSDFGLVLGPASDAAPGARGTLAYTSPEQARGERVDGRSDLYSLAVVLAEALSGQRLRAAADDDEALAIARAGAPIAVDGPLAHVIARATRTAPTERFADADEMLIAIEREAAALGVGREASVRDLATRIAALAPADAVEQARPAVATPPTAPDETADLRQKKPSSEAEETYYRGNESASFVDAVLGAPPQDGAKIAVNGRRRRGRARLAIAAIAALVAVAGAVGIGARALWSKRSSTVTESRSQKSESTPSKSESKSTKPEVELPRAESILSSAVTGAKPAAPLPPVEIAARRSSPAHAPPPRAPVATGTLLVQCTPWCVPYVDDTARGPDRKNHTLTLPAGSHHVEARRLGDRLERVVEIHAGQRETVDFEFR